MNDATNRQPSGRNYTTLAQLHTIEGIDDRVSFDEVSHTYHVDGMQVPISVTKCSNKSQAKKNSTPTSSSIITWHCGAADRAPSMVR